MLKQSSTHRARELVPSHAAASEIAVAALSHIAQDPDVIGQFLAQAGLAPEDLRSASQTPGFLTAVLEFLCADETQLRAFAANAGHSPETVDNARKVLAGPGGDWSA